MEAGALTRGSAAAPGATGGSLLVGLRPRRGEQVIKGLLAAAALLSVVTTIGIVFSLLRETIAFFGDVSIGDFITGTEWSPLFADPRFGVLPLVTGTLVITAIALLVAIPLGLAPRS